MDPANLVRTRTIRSENGLKPAEYSSDSLQDMSSPCESPHAGKVKFMCSFGGKILPRPSDGVLRYVGGETRLISIPRNFSWKELVHKTLSLYNQPHTIKYQLPDEDLDALISLSCEEDLQNMMEEYYSLEKANGSPRLRMFLVSPNDCEETSLSARSLESEPEYHFVVAVNNLSQLKQSTSGNNLVSQLSQQLDSSLLPCRDSTACQTDIESGAATSSPGLNRQRMSLNQSRLRMSADKLTTHQEHEHKYEVINGSHLKTMLPDHQDKTQSDADTGVGTGSTMHNIQIQRQAKDLGIPRNESYVSSHTSYDKSTPMEMPFYSEKVCVHPEAASWLSGMHEYTGQIHGMPHAFSDPLLNDRTEQPASNLSLTFDSYIPPSFSQTMCQANALERTISGTRPDLLCAKPPQIARVDEPNYLVSSHTDQRYDQGVPGGASFEAAVYYQQDSLSSNMVQTGHDSGPVVQQRKIYHPENSAGPSVAPQCTFVDTRFTLHQTPCARLSSANSDRGSHVEKMNSGRVSTDYGTAGCVHGNDKVAPGPHILLPIDPFEAFAPQRSVANGASPVYQNENYDQFLVHSSGLATSSPIGLSNADLTGNMFNNGTFKDGLSQRDVPVFNQHNIICSDVGVIGFDRATINNEDMNLRGRMHNDFQMEAHVIVEDVTDNMPSSIPSSRPIPQVEIAAEEQHHAINSSEKDDDAKSDGPELANEDHGNKAAADGTISDAEIAELEASMYGLQIIRNADLEELRELGSGTFGTVYHGKWRGSDVAIKRIKKSCFAGRSSEQEKLTKDFWREAQILSKLHHPNVVAFYGVVPDGTGGTLATVAEFMVNGSLRNVLLRKDRSLDLRKKLIIAMDAAFGMEYLHSKSIVHFDLKCDNLLVNLRDPQRPICKVGDFGLSRIKRNTLVSGGVRGTLPWMAPELLNGSSSKVSEKVDVFSFGIALWEILTGEEPYANMHCGAIIGGIVNNSLRPPVPETCDPEWRILMEQCWSANPDIRPSFTEVTDRLRAMSAMLQSRAQAPGS
ncbi:hypothetical protein CFC21_064374 [Triticum aestivum]|uniref:Protein kinase domain-containing protein n=2 Tax=Triticum aestivum TaxID=4565 RepID=A0A3B6KCZ3_WHEAT|nr:hypothetical protein CFC21_064374 [Triticum aestivum]